MNKISIMMKMLKMSKKPLNLNLNLNLKVTIKKMIKMFKRIQNSTGEVQLKRSEADSTLSNQLMNKISMRKMLKKPLNLNLNLKVTMTRRKMMKTLK